MASAYRAAVQACSSSAKHLGALATIIAAICTAGVCPLPLHGQWTTVPPGISYTGGNVGIGTNNPQSSLHLFGTGFVTQHTLETFNSIALLAIKSDQAQWELTTAGSGVGYTGDL
jgi:hypothetical protein